jgi:poly(hydroxyalkanoate) depolymerase family esterase
MLQRLFRRRGWAAGTARDETGATVSSVDQGGDMRRTPSMLRRLIGHFRRVDTQAKEPGAAIVLAPEIRPAVTPEGGRFIAGSYANFAGVRSYRLYIPGVWRGQALPLIVMLHGCKQSPEDFAAGTRMNAIAEEQGFFVVYPAQSKYANGSKCWNWFSPRHQHRGRGEPSIIAGITRQVMGEYNIDARRVYAAGLSAGGAATAVMSATYPDLYAAVGIHSGVARGAACNVPTAFAAMRHGNATIEDLTPLAPGLAGGRPLVPTIVFQGDKDDTVHPSNSAQLIEQAKPSNGPPLRAMTKQGRAAGGRDYSRTLHLDANGQALLEMWTVHESGHAWSGGSPDGSYTDPLGPDASREMARFFLAHILPEAEV